jgi:hypothetical protein
MVGGVLPEVLDGVDLSGEVLEIGPRDLVSSPMHCSTTAWNA